MKKRKVIILGNIYDLAGPYPRRCAMFGSALREAGHHVEFVIPVSETSGKVRSYDGFTIHSFQHGSPPVALGRLFWARFQAWWWLARRMSSGQIDWLVLYMVGIEGVIYALTARLLGTRIAISYEDVLVLPIQATWFDKLRAFLFYIANGWLPRLSDFNMGISTFLRDRLQKIAPNIPAVVIPPMHGEHIYADAQAVSVLQKEYMLEDAVVIGYFGSFWIVNGVKNLLLAVRRLVDQGLPIKVLIAGRMAHGHDCDDVADLIPTLRLEKQVIYMGLLSQTDVFHAMGACDILTVPRIDHVANEAGVPTKLGEYLFLGKAVVAAAIGDIPLYVRDGEDGLLIPPGDVSALVVALRRLVVDADLRQHLATNAPEAGYRGFYFKNAAKPLVDVVSME